MCVLFPPRFGGGKSKVEKGVFIFILTFFLNFLNLGCLRAGQGRAELSEYLVSK